MKKPEIAAKRADMYLTPLTLKKAEISFRAEDNHHCIYKSPLEGPTYARRHV